MVSSSHRMFFTGLLCWMVFGLSFSAFSIDHAVKWVEDERPEVIQLVYFKGKLLRDQVLLTWMSAVDLEHNGFSVEMKLNNQSWEKIGWIEATSESFDSPEYKFVFEDLMTGQYYFRLVQEDMFGVETFSNVVSLHFTGQPDSIVAYTDKESALLFFEGPPSERVEHVMLFDFSGNVVFETDHLESGNMVSIAHLASGQYVLECDYNGVRARTHVMF